MTAKSRQGRRRESGEARADGGAGIPLDRRALGALWVIAALLGCGMAVVRGAR